MLLQIPDTCSTGVLDDKRLMNDCLLIDVSGVSKEVRFVVVEVLDARFRCVRLCNDEPKRADKCCSNRFKISNFSDRIMISEKVDSSLSGPGRVVNLSVVIGTSVMTLVRK